MMSKFDTHTCKRKTLTAFRNKDYKHIFLVVQIIIIESKIILVFLFLSDELLSFKRFLKLNIFNVDLITLIHFVLT